MEIERENVIFGLPEEVFSFSNVVEEKCETLEPVVDVSIPSSFARGNLVEDALQWEVGAEREEHPFENLLVEPQYQALNIKNSSDIAEDMLMISSQQNYSSSVNANLSTPVVCEMRSESDKSDESTVTDISYSINTRNVNCGQPMRGAVASRRKRGARHGHQTAKARPAHNSVTFHTVPLAPANAFSPAFSALPAHPVSRQGRPSIPKPLPEPPKGAQLFMVRRHLDDVLQKIITKVVRTGRKRSQTAAPQVTTRNIDDKCTSESDNKRLKPLCPSVPILETNGKIADTTLHCSVGEQDELQHNLTLCSGIDENIASMHEQSSGLHSSSANIDIMALSTKLLEQLHSSQVLEGDAITANVTTLRKGGEEKLKTSHDVRLSTELHKNIVEDEATIDKTAGSCLFVAANSYCSPLNTDESFPSEQNLIQVTSTLENNTASNVHINKPIHSSFPAFDFAASLSRQLSTAKTSSPQSALNTDDFPPLNADNSYLSENNLLQVASTSENNTAQNVYINKAARSSFPPFNLATSFSHQSLSTAMPYLQSALNTPKPSVASRRRVSAPMLEASSVLPHFTFEDSKCDVPADHSSITPKQRDTEETTQLQSDSTHHDGMPVTNMAHDSSAISANSKCQGKGEPGNGSPEPTVMTAVMSPSISPEAPVSPTPQEIPVLALTGDVSPRFQEDSDCSSSLNLPPGNYAPPKEPKRLTPWRRRPMTAKKLSNSKSGNETPVSSSTHSSGDNIDETRRPRKNIGSATARKRCKAVHPCAKAAPVCDLCGRGFSSFCQLTSHVRLHTASARCFFCSLCKQRFLHLDALAAHARRRHNVKLTSPKGSGKPSIQLQRPFAYSCSVCEEVLEGRSTLVNHLLSKHSAPSGETVQRVAPALLVATRMRGTAWCTPFGSSNTDTSRQSRGDTKLTSSSSDVTDQASVHSRTNISQGVDKTCERLPSPIAVSSRSNSPFSSRSTVSPPNSPHSICSVLELSDDLVSSNVSCSVNVDISNEHVTGMRRQVSSKLVTSHISECPVHSNSDTHINFSTSFDSSASKSSRKKSRSTLKSYSKETSATSVNLPHSLIKNRGITVYDENSNERQDITDSSSAEASYQNSSVQCIQKVIKTQCPVHYRLRSSSSQSELPVKISCPIHQKTRCSDESSRLHPKSPASPQVKESLKKSKHCPKANVLDPTSSFTSPGKGLSSCVSHDKLFEPVVLLERIEGIESITVE